MTLGGAERWNEMGEGEDVCWRWTWLGGLREIVWDL